MSVNFVPPVHLGFSEDEKGIAQGAEAIARVLGVNRDRIVDWKKKGAPIYLVGRKYQCRYDELWEWIGQNERRLYTKG